VIVFEVSPSSIRYHTLQDHLRLHIAALQLTPAVSRAVQQYPGRLSAVIILRFLLGLSSWALHTIQECSAIGPDEWDHGLFERYTVLHTDPGKVINSVLGS
jgi:hypothetical protein